MIKNKSKGPHTRSHRTGKNTSQVLIAAHKRPLATQVNIVGMHVTLAKIPGLPISTKLVRYPCPHAVYCCMTFCAVLK